MAVPQGTETIDSFAQKIKSKYPAYRDKDNADLVKRIVLKYPQYQKVLSTETLQSLAHGDVPSLGQETVTVLGQAVRGGLKTIGGMLESVPTMLRQASPTGLSGADIMRNIATPSGVTRSIAEAPAKSTAGKLALGGIPGATTALSTADLAKRALKGKPLTGKSISELQSDVAEGAGGAAALAAIPDVGRYVEGMKATPAENLKLGLRDIDDALATTAGKAGRKAAKMTADIRVAAPDLINAADNIEPGLKGAEKMHAFTEEIGKRQREVWEKGHEAPISRHPDAPINSNAVANYALREISKRGERVALVNKPELDEARQWIDTAVRPEMTLRQADDFIRELNDDMQTKDPSEVGNYGNKGVTARLATLKALRAEIDNKLESLGEKGVRDYNKRWGALDKIRDQMKVRAVQLARKEARNRLDVMPRWAHIYSFWHGSGIPFLGLGIRGAEIFERTPADILMRGVERLRKSGIEPTPFPEERPEIPPRGLLTSGAKITPPPADTSFVRGVSAIAQAPEAVRKGRLLPQGEGIGPIPLRASQDQSRVTGTPAETAIPESAKTGRMLKAGSPDIYDPNSGNPPMPGQVANFMGRVWFFNGADWTLIR